MTWKMKIEYTFYLPERGRVVIGRPDRDPVLGKAVVEAHGERHEVEVVGIERFYKGHTQTGENYGLLLQALNGDDLRGCWDVAEGEISGSPCTCKNEYGYHSVSCPAPPAERPGV